MFVFRLLIVLGAFSISPTAQAGQADFVPGPVIPAYGAIARVEGAAPLPANASFKVAFDVSRPSDAGKVNRGLETATRFLNMHVASGVPESNIAITIVVHGAAAQDLTRPAAGAESPNAALIAALVSHGVRIYLCGQTAVALDIAAEDLLPGVQMALSAMTIHALLQQDGYTLNPF